MVTAIPVSAKITIVTGAGRYTNNNIKIAADNEDLLSFAGALSSLRKNPIADRYEKYEKYELKND